MNVTRFICCVNRNEARDNVIDDSDDGILTVIVGLVGGVTQVGVDGVDVASGTGGGCGGANIGVATCVVRSDNVEYDVVRGKSIICGRRFASGENKWISEIKMFDENTY